MSRVDRVSEVAVKLEQAILSGELSPGDQLPSEREICVTLGVSRSVVREALGRLTSLGLVRSVHGSGTRVEAPTGRQVTLGYQRLLHRADLRLEDLSAVRLPLETAIASLAAMRRTDEQLAELESTQGVLGDAARTLREQVEADLRFHTVLAAASGNALFELVLAPIRELLVESRRQTLGAYGAEIAHGHHALILAAVRAGDAQGAAQAMQAHIEASGGHVQQLVSGPAGQ